MKAYEVQYKDSEWCDFVHASHVEDAKISFWKAWATEGEFIDVRAVRVPELDNKALTGKNIVNAGFDEEWYSEKTYICECDLCKQSIHTGK